MPLFNPTIMVVPEDAVVRDRDTGEETIITDGNSLFKHNFIYCTKASSMFMLQEIDDNHPDTSIKTAK